MYIFCGNSRVTMLSVVRCCALVGEAWLGSFICATNGYCKTLGSRGNTDILSFRRRTRIFFVILRSRWTRRIRLVMLTVASAGTSIWMMVAVDEMRGAIEHAFVFLFKNILTMQFKVCLRRIKAPVWTAFTFLCNPPRGMSTSSDTFARRMILKCFSGAPWTQGAGAILLREQRLVLVRTRCEDVA